MQNLLYINSNTLKLGKDLRLMDREDSEDDAYDLEAGSSNFNSNSDLPHMIEQRFYLDGNDEISFVHKKTNSKLFFFNPLKNTISFLEKSGFFPHLKLYLFIIRLDYACASSEFSITNLPYDFQSK